TRFVGCPNVAVSDRFPPYPDRFAMFKTLKTSPNDVNLNIGSPQPMWQKRRSPKLLLTRKSWEKKLSPNSNFEGRLIRGINCPRDVRVPARFRLKLSTRPRKSPLSSPRLNWFILVPGSRSLLLPSPLKSTAEI